MVYVRPIQGISTQNMYRYTGILYQFQGPDIPIQNLVKLANLGAVFHIGDGILSTLPPVPEMARSRAGHARKIGGQLLGG